MLTRDELRDSLRNQAFFVEGGWAEPIDARAFGAETWRPDFVSATGVMCVHIGDEIKSYLGRRIRAAAESGQRITVVTGLDALTEPANIELLSAVDSSIVFVADDGVPHPPSPILKVLAEQEVLLDVSTRSSLVATALERCDLAITSNEKGSRLEHLVHFLFAQVPDFRVLKCNWRTLTEELDCVIQIRAALPTRCWSQLSAPYIVVEAKNRQEKTGQDSVSKLKGILDGKRKTARIGILVSLSGFTSDATDQVLRFSIDDKIFVLLSREDLRNLSRNDDLESALEKFVTKAMLA